MHTDDSFAMKRIHWRLLHCPHRVKCWLSEKMENCHLAMFTLCYNQFTSCNTMFDAALEPMFWLVDHFTKYMGPVSNGNWNTVLAKRQLFYWLNHLCHKFYS